MGLWLYDCGYELNQYTLPPIALLCSLLAEKAFVTGVEAVNAVVKRLGVGQPVSIIPLEEDEPHIKALRAVNGRAKRAVKALPGAGWLLP